MVSSNEIPAEDGSQIFLVDFEQKAIVAISEKREEDRRKHEEEQKRLREEKEADEDRRLLEEAVEPAAHPEDEW